eukprot:4152950-Amphidinium_carterae.1
MHAWSQTATLFMCLLRLPSRAVQPYCNAEKHKRTRASRALTSRPLQSRQVVARQKASLALGAS